MLESLLSPYRFILGEQRKRKNGKKGQKIVKKGDFLLF
jgi:hypothetical protein